MLPDTTLRHWAFVAAGLLLCALAAPAAHGDATPADRSLVLHYVFDQNPGAVAKDLSSYKNDGKIVKAAYLEEVNGQRGVLRFDAGDAVLNCPDSDSLGVNGDLSFEMTVRLNDIVRKPWALLFGDDDNYAFYIAEYYSLVLYYSTYNESMRRGENVDLPVERRIVSDKWSHIAVVVEYPRCRFYCDGQLVRDSYMVVPGISQRSRQPIRMGLRCPMDLHEVRLYKRALTPEEVIAHAKGQEIPPARAVELAVEPDWYAGTVAVRLTGKGGGYSGDSAKMTLLKGDGVEAVASQRAVLKEVFQNSGRYSATVTFPLSGLENQSLDAVGYLLGPDGKVLNKACHRADIRKPEWVGTKEGYSDEVLPPWTPVEAKEAANKTVEVNVWGRKQVFGTTPFIQRIQSGGEELLTAPMSLTGKAGGQELSFKDGQVKLVKSSPTKAEIEQSFENERASFKINASIEYDGYMIFDCELKARRDLSVENLQVEIPLQARYAALCYGDRVYPPNDDKPIAENHGGSVKGDLAFRFSPCIWLGNEERGLTWQAESDEDWRNADVQKAIEVLPRGEKTAFLAHLADKAAPLAAGKSLHYKFAIQATPVKPILRDQWELRIARSEPYGADLNLPDRKTDGKPTLQRYVELGIRHLFINVCDVWPMSMPVHQQFSLALHRLIDDAHAAGLCLHPYVIHERFATSAQPFDIYGRQMCQSPISHYIPGNTPPAPGNVRPGPIGHEYGADSQGTEMACFKSQAAQDAFIHDLAQRLHIFGDDGVYLDGTAQTPPCDNPLHGCGYRAKDGTMHKTYPVFAVREFMRRIYTVVRQRRPDGIVDEHSSFGSNPPALAYADMLWTGEQWWHLRGTGAKNGYISGELSLDMFRAEFMATPWGVPAETLAYRLGPPMKVAAISLLHDVPVRPSTGEDPYYSLILKLWKVRDEFGDKEAQKLFYWNNQDYAQVSPEKCYATLFKHPKNGVLAFITNLSPSAQTVTLQFNLEKLGLRGQKFDVFNALTHDPATMTADGKLSVSLGSEEWAYVWLRPSADK
jgi:hypothetical protein